MERLLWEHHSRNEHLSGVTLSPPTLQFFLLLLPDDFLDALALILFFGEDPHSSRSSDGGWEIRNDRIMMKRTTGLSELCQTELEETTR